MEVIECGINLPSPGCFPLCPFHLILWKVSFDPFPYFGMEYRQYGLGVVEINSPHGLGGSFHDGENRNMSWFACRYPLCVRNIRAMYNISSESHSVEEDS